MANKRLYSLIATVVAFFAYIVVITSIIAYIKSSEKDVKDFGYNVDEAIVVELDTKPSSKPNPEKKLNPIKPPTPKPVIEKKQIVEPEPKIIEPEPKQEIEPQKEIVIDEPKITQPKEPIESEVVKEKEQEARDIEAKSAKDLFSTVRAKDYNKLLEERKKEDAARASRLAKQKAIRKKREEERKKRAKAIAAAKALLQDFQVSASSHKKRGEKDEFWSPISSKIMAKWNRTISTQDGLMAEVRIRIDNRGRLSYKIKRLSNNSLFDTKLKVFLENLEYEKFPRYKDGPYIEAIFEFKDQAN